MLRLVEAILKPPWDQLGPCWVILRPCCLHCVSKFCDWCLCILSCGISACTMISIPRDHFNNSIVHAQFKCAFKVIMHPSWSMGQCLVPVDLGWWQFAIYVNLQPHSIPTTQKLMVDEAKNIRCIFWHVQRFVQFWDRIFRTKKTALKITITIFLTHVPHLAASQPSKRKLYALTPPKQQNTTQFRACH